MAALTFEATPNFSGVCAGCEREFVAYVRPCRPARRFCSAECGARAMAGRKQSPDHVASRVRRGADHPRWLGDEASRSAGHARAWRRYRDIGPCVRCGAEKSERHHRDGNTLNNEPENIEVLCRRCHMEADARLVELINARRRAAR